MASSQILSLTLVFGALFLGGLIGLLIQRRLIAAEQRLHQQQLTQLSQEVAEHRQAHAGLQQDFRALQGREQEGQRELAVLRERNESAMAIRQKLDRELEEERVKNATLSTQLAQRDSEYRHLKTSTDEKIALLSEARKELTDQFEQLANRIFEEKTERLQRNSQDSLALSLKPFRDQLQEFRSRVDHIYDNENRQRGELREQLKSLQELNHNIGREAQNLTKALKGDNKAQGNWGEVILERVLEESGLRKGHEYITQASYVDDSGRRRQPDVIVRLPDEKDIIVDAKVSLLAYERYCSSEDETERAGCLRDHLQSVRQHLAGLSTKAYQHMEGIRSLDFVFIFIPIEAAFMTAFEHDPDLFRSAYEKNIIVVGPTTLLATLRTVQSIWRYERQNQNAEKIAKEAGALHDQFALVVESLEEIGKHLEKGQGAYEKTLKRMTEGRGNLVGRVARLEALGAKVKKSLPVGLTEQADVQRDDDDNLNE